MYLTRFRINTERVGARKLLSSPQTLHAAVMSSFAELPAQQDGPRVLWRIDRRARHRTHLCIVSPCKPDLTTAAGNWPTTARWDTYDHGLPRTPQPLRPWAFRSPQTPSPVRNRDGVPTKTTPHLTRASWRTAPGGRRIQNRPQTTGPGRGTIQQLLSWSSATAASSPSRSGAPATGHPGHRHLRRTPEITDPTFRRTSPTLKARRTAAA